MKKFIGWVLVGFCSLLLIVFLSSLIIISPEFADNQKPILESLSTIGGFVLIITILTVGLINGIKRIRKPSQYEINEYNGELNLELNGQIKYEDYRNYILTQTFKKPIYLVLFVVFILLIINLLISEAGIISQFMDNPLIFIVFGAVFLAPVITLIQIKKIYKTNKFFHEVLTYRINNEGICIKGKTVDSTQNWSHFYQIKETKSFFMLYQGKMVATILDKSMFNEEESEEFQCFIKSLNIFKK